MSDFLFVGFEEAAAAEDCLEIADMENSPLEATSIDTALTEREAKALLPRTTWSAAAAIALSPECCRAASLALLGKESSITTSKREIGSGTRA